MKNTHWLLFISSAFLYAAPLLWSALCWPLVFIFAAPFLYVTLYNNLTLRQAIIWSVIAFGSHLSGVIAGLDNIAVGSIFARLAPTFVLITIAGTYATIWLVSTQALKRYLHINTIQSTLILWTTTYWLFIMFMEFYSFIPFGRIEGYFLFNPIFVLGHQPHLLTLLTCLGKSLLTYLLLALSASCVYAYTKRTYLSYALILLLASPWLISLTIPIPTMEEPSWLNEITHIQTKVGPHPNLTLQAHMTRNILQMAAADHPEAKLLIMPESAIFCDHLSDAPELCALWSQEQLGQPMHLILGSFRWDGPSYRNSLMWFYDGKLQQIFDKRHAMLLTEELPKFCNLVLFKKLFFSKYPGIVPGVNERPKLAIIDGIEFIPYICSELFFNDVPDDKYLTGTTILAISNDMWCMRSNIADLMHVAARFRAVQWQRNIVYISYAHGTYFDRFGNELSLYN